MHDIARRSREAILSVLDEPDLSSIVGQDGNSKKREEPEHAENQS